MSLAFLLALSSLSRSLFLSPFQAILSPDTTYYHYQGSLTTPPCTEGVNWFVLTQPVSISRAQLEAYRNFLAELPNTDKGNNARPTNPLNGRLVEMGGVHSGF